MKISTNYSYNYPIFKPTQKQYQPTFTGYRIAKTYLSLNKIPNKIFNRNFRDLNMFFLEGIQKGLKSFEGLSIKQIAFALTNLQSINMLNGCTNHCLHCYANAQPKIIRYPWEDLVQICSDIKELSDRIGMPSIEQAGDMNTIECFFDSDALDIYLFDKDGRKHNYVEIADLFIDKLGLKPIFDTNGWKISDTKKQSQAEECVKQLMENDNYKKFEQINISINPFNPQYIQVLNSGYDIKDLYSVFYSKGTEGEWLTKTLSEDFKKVRDKYTQYIKDVANTLCTFKPLLDYKNFGIITRVFHDSNDEMKGFRKKDFKETIKHIKHELVIKQQQGLITNKEVQKMYKLLDIIIPGLIMGGRLEKFYKVKTHGKIPYFIGQTNRKYDAQDAYKNLEKHKILSYSQLNYRKMITADGKVYLFDNYRIIPTDIRLKTSTPDIKQPFKIKMENFVVTEDMIDEI